MSLSRELAIDLSINEPDVRRLLIDFIRNQVTHNGFQKVIIGLSGGIDSTLACYLLTEALGADNVYGVRMPSTTSSSESMEHAQLVEKSTGITMMTIPIGGIVDAFISKLPDVDSIRKGNMMARIRMIVLFDQSAAKHALVVGTGNKTEILLGYSTLYGDAACAFNPLGDLYKTQIRQLAKAMKVPEAIIQKPPSADLWVGQTDEGELGFTYEQVDRLLFLLVDKHKTPAECEQLGFEKDFIDQVISRIRRYRYKRIMPPIARITDGNAGLDL